MTRTRIYVAGSYSADNVIAVLDNMRRGMRACTVLMLAGYAPFCPWMDYHYQLNLRGGEHLAVSDYYEYSLAWLAVSDALLVLPGSEDSVGTQGEIRYAQEHGMPVYFDINYLIQKGGQVGSH